MQTAFESIVTNTMAQNAHLVCVQDTHSAFVVDPGGAADEILALCQAHECELTDILLTHGHFDHIQAVAELHERTGAHVHIHPNDADMLVDVKRSLGHVGVAQVQTAADRLLDVLESAELEICGLKLTVIYTPGHTAGSVSYYLPEQGVLMSGDTLFCEAFGRTDLPSGSAMQLRRSLRKLFKLPADTRVLSGHGPETTIGHEVGER